MNRQARISMALRVGRGIATELLATPGATIKRAARSISGYETWNVVASNVPYRVLQAQFSRSSGENNMGGGEAAHSVIVPWNTPVKLNDTLIAGGRTYHVVGERSNPAYRVQRVLLCVLYQDWTTELP